MCFICVFFFVNLTLKINNNGREGMTENEDFRNPTYALYIQW